MNFRHYKVGDYEEVRNFLIELNKDSNHINWNWARFEWMIGHPDFDSGLLKSIGLWYDEDKLVGIAIYDMYFGEASCLTLPEYYAILPEIVKYAYEELQDDNGLGICIADDSPFEYKILRKMGFSITEQKETIMSINLDKELSYKCPKNLTIQEINPEEEYEAIMWMFWQGFDHGEDKEEFLKNEQKPTQKRPNFNVNLSLCAKNEAGEFVSYCCLWYDKKTDYAYVEPVCTIPSYRGQGIARALIYEALNRVRLLGAKKAYVISDSDFYKKLGFSVEKVFTFYWKKDVIKANKYLYRIVKLLGKGKGGYSYLANSFGEKVVVKKIHYEPCSYYKFGNKIEAEINDYNRLLNAGIRIPKMIAVDKENEVIIKEYINGPTIFDLVNNDEMNDDYLLQVREMASLAKQSGLNIDYFPTNFVVQEGKLYYVDYECNEYMDEWNFENWGIKYWSKTPEFMNHIYQEYKKKVRSLIGKEVSVIVDRPLGSHHPKHKDLVYKVNYGYINDFCAPDNEKQDVYILGVDEPVKTFFGVAIAIIEREDDNEDKLVVIPHNSLSYSDEEIEKEVNFQEQHFKHHIRR